MAISDNWRKIIIGAVIVFAILIILIGLMVGMQGLKQFFQFIIIGLLVIAILFGIAYVFYILFIQVTFKDIPAQFKKKLHSVTKVMKNELLGTLFLSGDTKHNRIALGKYFYMRINLPKIVKSKNESLGSDSIIEQSSSEAVPIDCFIVSKKGFINKLFNEPFFVLVKPQDHDYSSIFNDVTIKGFNLVPLDAQFFTIDRRNLDLDMVKGMSLNYIREVVFSIFADLDKLVKQAMNLDQQFQKEKERTREFEIPAVSNILQRGEK